VGLDPLGDSIGVFENYLKCDCLHAQNLQISYSVKFNINTLTKNFFSRKNISQMVRQDVVAYVGVGRLQNCLGHRDGQRFAELHFSLTGRGGASLTLCIHLC
jgi:hypothetical protein